MGTTAEKLTYLNNTKLAIKNELNKLGAEIEDSDTFRSYATALETIYNDYPTVSGSGSSISLNNTKKAPFKEISLNSTELTQDGTPSPSSPVDVNVIKGDNTITISNSDSSEEQNYKISLASKNLFTTTGNFSLVTGYSTYEIIGTNSLSVTSTGTTYSYRYVRFKLSNLVIGQKYYVSADFVNSDDTTTIPLYIRNTADNTTLNSDDSFVSGSYLSFTATETSAMIRFYASGATAKINTCTWTNIMVSTSNEDTFEPYYNLEYCKIGDYADQIFKNTTDSPFYDNTLVENEWYLKKKVLKIDSYNGETITTPYISTTGGLDTGATIYYGLSTPTYTQISQENYPTLRGQLEDIYNNSKSYNGQTNITQTNDDLPFNLSVSILEK